MKAYTGDMPSDSAPPDTPVDLDAELKAMNSVKVALDGLSDASRNRVLRWAADAFSITLGDKPRDTFAQGNPTGLPAVKSAAAIAGSDLAEFFAKAAPKTDAEKALVAAAWKQSQQDEPTDWFAQDINTDLKQLGHGVGNITDALSSLMSRKPALVIQTRKEGTSRQARKKYKVTSSGLSEVARMGVNSASES